MIRPACLTADSVRVAPFTGAWIEISKRASKRLIVVRSHPSRVRGLKYAEMGGLTLWPAVAPFTGAWIEIYCDNSKFEGDVYVAPFTGAWIEIRPK